MESWGGYQDLHAAFVKWLQITYSSLSHFICMAPLTVHTGDEEKSRREGYSPGRSAETTPAPDAKEPTDPTPTNELTTPAGQRSPNPDINEPTNPTPTNEPTMPGGPPSPNLAINEPVGPIPTNEPTTPGVSSPPNPYPLATPNHTANAQPASSPEVAVPGSPRPVHTPTTTTLVANSMPLPAAPERTSPPMMLPPTVPPVAAPQPTPLGPPSTPGIHTPPFKHDPLYPDFITTTVIEHLNSVDGGPCWVEMLSGYLELERNYSSRVSYSS